MEEVMAKKQVNFKTYLEIDKANLDENMSKLPALIYDFGLKQIRLEDEILKLELKLEIIESKIAGSKRAAYKNVSKSKMPTETTIRDQVRYHPEVIELKQQILDRKHYLKLAKLKSKTLSVKKDMIENISHNVREERKSSKRIK